MLEHFQRYDINKIHLYFLGVWSYQSKLSSNLISFFFLVYQISYYPFQILMLYDHWNDSQIVFKLCYQLAILIYFVLKIFNPIWNREKFKCICIAMNDHSNVFTSNLEVQSLNDYSNVSQKLTIVYSTSLYFMTLIFVIAPLIPIFLDIIHPLNETRPRLFPITVKFRMDHEKYYIQIYCYIVGLILTGIINAIASDTTFLVYITHACGLFSIIGRQFEEVITKLHVYKYIRKFECCSNTEIEFENERMMYQEYIICLKKYQLALEFVDMLNSAYKIISLFLLILYGATFVGMQITTSLDRLEDKIRHTSVIIGILAQLMISCYSGQKLQDKSQNIFYRVYAAEWYNCSSRLKSLILITLYRSAVPCNLTAGNIVPLSMVTYSLVVRTAGSYFMTFLSLKQ